MAKARAAIVVFMLLAVTACGPSVEPVSIGAALPAVNPGASPFRALLADSRDLGRLTGSHTVSFVVRLRARTDGSRALAEMYRPGSKRFGRYASPGQWARLTGPLPGAIARVRRFLSGRGVTFSWHGGQSWAVIRGPAGAVERVFDLRIDRYVARSGTHFYASARDPRVPPALKSLIIGTSHLTSYADHHTQIIPVDGLTPPDLLAAYDIKPLRDRGLNGSGETVAFIEIDGYNQSDLDAFSSHFGLPAMHPVIGAGGRIGQVQGEAELDMEVVHEIAPRARLVLYNCGSGCTDSDFLSRERAAVSQNAKGIISISVGGCESQEGQTVATAENNVFAGADATGVSVFAASGDSGAYTCLDSNWGAVPGPQYVGVSAPASDPTLTAVGGTLLSVRRNSSWNGEAVWQDPPATAGSGGGVSVYFRRPGWQKGPGVANSYSASGRREVPDVAADADPIGSVQIVINGNLTEAGGTSQAAPIWAGITALIDQYLRQNGQAPAGFVNPALYTLAAGHPAYPPLHDVTVGTNLKYPATPGYDMATGLGTPDAWNLARDLLTYERGGS